MSSSPGIIKCRACCRRQSSSLLPGVREGVLANRRRCHIVDLGGRARDNGGALVWLMLARLSWRVVMLFDRRALRLVGICEGQCRGGIMAKPEGIYAPMLGRR